MQFGRAGRRTAERANRMIYRGSLERIPAYDAFFLIFKKIWRLLYQVSISTMHKIFTVSVLESASKG